MSAIEDQSALIIAPKEGAITNTAITAASTAAIDIWGGVQQEAGLWTFSYKAADVHIHFGTAAIGAATVANAAYRPAGLVEPIWISNASRYFRAIGTTAPAGAVISFHRSSPS